LQSTDAVEILLVEDNDADSELALHALEKSQLANKIRVVRDGEEALDFLFCRGQFSNRHFEEAPRMVLLDLKLPKVDGLQVLQQIKADERTRAIPIVMLTTSREESDMVQSYKSGANSYIQKPVNFAEFQEVVRQLGLYWLVVNTKPPEGAFIPR
jgi:CheY-like chemotaxis protein